MHPVSDLSRYYTAKLAPKKEKVIVKKVLSNLLCEVVEEAGKPLGTDTSRN